MAYGLRWNIPFVSFDGTNYEIHISEKNYTGSSVDLKGAATPITIDEDDDDDAFMPIRTSSGYINIIVEDTSVIDEIMPSDILEHRVLLLRENSSSEWDIVWAGYIIPEEYSNDWRSAPIEVSFPIQSLGATLSQIDFTPEYCVRTVSDILNSICADSTFGNCNFVNFEYATYYSIDDSVWATDEKDEWHTYGGEGGNIQLPTECKSQYDVVEEICKYFGLQCREIGGVFTFYMIDDTTSRSTSALPDIKSADNKRDHLRGRSYISITENLPTPPDPIDADASHKDGSNAVTRAKVSIWATYPRDIDTETLTYQYNSSGTEQTGSTVVDMILQHYNKSTSYFGANLVMIYRATQNASIYPSNLSDYNSGLAIYGNATYNESKPFVKLTSKRDINGKSYPGGLYIKGTVYMDPVDGGNYNWDHNPNCTFKMKVMWGNMCWNSSTKTWQSSSYISEARVINSEGSGDGSGYIANPSDSDAFFISSNDNLSGKIVITIYGISNASKGIVLIEDFEVTPKRDNSVLFYDRQDLSENRWRQQLSGAQLDIYEVSTDLSTHMHSQQISNGIVFTSGGYAQEIVRENLMTRLATWYDRSIEKLTVTVEDDGTISPLTLFTYNNNTYTVTAISHNYRDSQSTLTLQRLP